MRKGARTKQQMIDTAMGLFQKQGYRATGVNQVLAESGAPRGSLYFHFPGGKRQLAAESVAGAGEHVREQIQMILDRSADPDAAIAEVVEFFCAVLEGSDFQSGCPIATVALEIGAGEPDVQQACGAAYESWLQILRLRLIGWGVERDRAAELATVALSMIEGALLLARVQRDFGALRAAGNQLALLLGAARAGA